MSILAVLKRLGSGSEQKPRRISMCIDRSKLLILMRVGVFTLAASLVASTFAAAQSTPNARALPLMEREKEVALALNSCPASIAGKAAVYVLEKSGYVKVRNGGNGFTAIVQHAAPDSQEPQCMDAEGARTFLPRIMKVAELRAQGKSPEQIQAFVSDATAKGIIPTPTHPGVIYMLGQNLLSGGKGTFPPHVMFYGTHLTNTDLGVDSKDVDQNGTPRGPSFVVSEDSPYALIIVPAAAHTTGH
jgi:hypothetical protein